MEGGQGGGGAQVAARALYDYEAAEADECSLRAGTAVIVLLTREDGWLYGMTPEGTYGFFPASYVELLPDPAAAALAESSLPRTGGSRRPPSVHRPLSARRSVTSGPVQAALSPLNAVEISATTLAGHRSLSRALPSSSGPGHAAQLPPPAALPPPSFTAAASSAVDSHQQQRRPAALLSSSSSNDNIVETGLRIAALMARLRDDIMFRRHWLRERSDVIDLLRKGDWFLKVRVLVSVRGGWW